MRIAAILPSRLRGAAAALPPPPQLLAAFLLAVPTAGFALLAGPAMMQDSPTYAFWADRLVDAHFHYLDMAHAYGSAVSLTYALFVTFVALLRLAFGGYWAAALIAVNAASVVAVGALLVRLTFRLTASGAAAWTALALYGLSWDVQQWVPRVGSDASFLLFAYSVFLMEARRILSGGGRWLPVFAASAAASLYRPTGIVLFPITAWSFFLARVPGTARGRGRLLALLSIGAAACAFALAMLWQDPARWPFGFLHREIAAIAHGYSEGQVIWDRPGTYHQAPRAILDYWAITADRFVHFFAAGASGFSALHLAVQSLFYGLVYLLGLLFVADLIRGRTGMGRREQDACFAVLGAVLAYAFFHAIVQVDYDWRYRLPIMPHLILLAAAGAGQLAARRDAGAGIMRGGVPVAASAEAGRQR